MTIAYAEGSPCLSVSDMNEHINSFALMILSCKLERSGSGICVYDNFKITGIQPDTIFFIQNFNEGKNEPKTSNDGNQEESPKDPEADSGN